MKFDMTAAWNEAVRLVSANRQVVLIVAGVFFFLPYAGFMMLMGDRMAAMEAAAASNPDQAMDQAMAFYGSIWWLFLIISVVQGIGMLGLLALLRGRSRPTVSEALAIGAKTLLPYLVVQLVIGFVIMGLIAIPLAAGAAGSVGAAVLLGLIALLAIAYLYTKFSLAPPVLVIERVLNPFAAMRRSWRLTKGSSVRLFLFYFLLVVAVVVVGAVISIVVGLVFALAGPETALIGNALVAALLNAIWVTLMLAALAAAHRQLAGERAEEMTGTFE